ncbi:MAG TPA: FmdB family zinc ribbon protein [Methylomirabilota bacterium]|jgi:putative FmdB family regulatory protein
MPTYEYECPKCPRVFEVRQRITEPALETCDRCGGPIHRLLSAAPFILKGEGWYVTDYPSDARKKATSAESSGKEAPSKETPSKETSSAKDAGGAESKPAASSESKSSTDGAASSASSTSKSS